MSLLRKFLPAPAMSAALFVVWLLLARAVDAGDILLGLVLAIAVPVLVTRLRFTSTRLRNPRVIARYALTVGIDVLHSNATVARDVIRWRWRPPAPAFVVVPLDLRDPVGLAVLAMVTTIVPGTVWSELALDRSALLLHVWDARDGDAFVARYKARYEQPLRDIFE
jgi:multicomponent K+:H+ antiporter subunit E